MWAHRPVAVFWKTFGVFPTGPRDRRAAAAHLLDACLLVACAYVLLAVPAVICRVGVKCTAESVRVLKQVYPGAVNATAAMSRAALLYSVRRPRYRRYRETLDCYERYAATGAPETARCRAFAAAAVAVCVLPVVPVHALRTCMLARLDGHVAALFAFVYVENVAMCCAETQFAAQCFALYRKLRRVNGDIAALNRTLRADFARYLDGRGSGSGRAHDRGPGSGHDRGSGSDVADAIESLRIRHWLMREAVRCLNGLFGTQLAMSVCALCVMAFFDIYNETFRVMGEYDYSALVLYCSLFHYAARYLCIILISHFTTKQVRGV